MEIRLAQYNDFNHYTVFSIAYHVTYASLWIIFVILKYSYKNKYHFLKYKAAEVFDFNVIDEC